jgi:hypothetical protein
MIAENVTAILLKKRYLLYIAIVFQFGTAPPEGTALHG